MDSYLANNLEINTFENMFATIKLHEAKHIDGEQRIVFVAQNDSSL